ncbi:hypothetical protein [Amycolatopsis sp. NPDC059657]|uniref:hypothetical protein n=1 Tax=Amycolatopsis sp. NPDC059657 TaxID=3346899 RepID=UPI00366B1243
MAAVNRLDFGDRRPPILAAADSLYTVLVLDRALGLIPINADVRVYVVNNDSLMITVGGLDDTFLLGQHTEKAADSQLAPEYYTASALRLRREIEDTVRGDLPRCGNGHPWFSFIVWLQPAVWAAKFDHHSHGVTTLNDDKDFA